MRSFLNPFAVPEELLCLMVPACLQWLILEKTEERWRSLRLVLLAPVCWMFYGLLGGALALGSCAFLIFLVFSLLMQGNFLWEALEFAGMFLTDGEILGSLARLVLLAAGWGLGWVLYAACGSRRAG